ncbi:GNAT family N-acetyltransferase [Rossellomorea vietnamensis]|uniref:GNAT family N-acetyltransferase n=2 Tax=Rossellomorea TaxID=2837508 RepID=A0A5D4KKJ4_9BACI|nr:MULTISPECIES: GNAT family protein [Rossellomorea]TYR77369.1 GNAT family N-acetyltransferase [Rossellomorea vietnamensis]TYS82316.1 GNAT family N-acetyltransferase [Rossellomorea aquimaris]
MTFPELETKRLKLIEITEKDIEAYFSVMSLDRVTKYYGMESLKKKEQAAEIIQAFRTGYESKRSMRWGIILKDTGAFIGTAGLNNLQTGQKKAEIGFEIHPDYWRSGITTEAANAVIRYAFEELHLFRIGAVTFLENHSSYGLLEKIGFKKEGILRGYIFQNGVSNDTYVYSLLRKEWQEVVDQPVLTDFQV